MHIAISHNLFFSAALHYNFCSMILDNLQWNFFITIITIFAASALAANVNVHFKFLGNKNISNQELLKTHTMTEIISALSWS